jgi:hypothetical protein
MKSRRLHSKKMARLVVKPSAAESHGPGTAREIATAAVRLRERAVAGRDASMSNRERARMMKESVLRPRQASAETQVDVARRWVSCGMRTSG